MKACCSEEIWQAYLDGELSPQTCDEAAAHLAQCVDCSQRLREAEATMRMIDAAFVELPEAVPTTRLQARIHSMLAEKAAPKFTLAWLWQWQWAAVAAAIVLALSLLLFRSANPSLPKDARAVAPAPARAPDVAITAPLTKSIVMPQVAKVHPRAPRRTPKRNAQEAEVVTPFFPLREGEDLTALDTLRLVRVELSGSALSEVGLAVALDTSNAPVIADVALGDDGLARAIRFVR